jgi:hypothetical protein
MRTLGWTLGCALLMLAAACGGKTAGDIIGGGGGGSGSDGGGGGGGGGADGGGGGDDGGGPLPPPDKHRATAVACGASPVPPEPNIDKTNFGPNPTFECKKNEDCTKQKGGRCAIIECGGFGGPACAPQGTRCDYDACSSDLDCTNGAVCDCGTGEGGTNRCVKSQCRTDAECGTDGYCSPSQQVCSSLIEGWYCHSSADTCRNDSDCASGMLGQLCMFTGSHFECSGGVCGAAAGAM